MKKRLLSAFLCAAMLATMIPAAFASDLDGHWSKNFIEYLDDEGIINPSATTGKYEPERKVTRAEFMRYVNRAFHFTEKANISYSDVQSNSWYYDTVRIAEKYGYINGTGNGRMNPEGYVTREQAAVILGRLYKADPGNVKPANLSFKDKAKVAAWSAGYVKAAVDKGIITGYKDNTFKPTKVITRAELAKILYYYLGTSLSTAGKAYTGSDLKSDTANVTISESCTLSDATIDGDLYLTEGLASDAVQLNDVYVKGTIIVAGGTVTMTNTMSDHIVVSSPMGRLLQVTAAGAARFPNTEVRSTAVLYEKKLTTPGYEGFADVKINGDKKVSLTLDADINHLELDTESTVSTTANASVYRMTASKPASVTGYGTIYQAEIKSSGVSFASSVRVSGYTIANGVTATAGGQTLTGSVTAAVSPESIAVDLNNLSALGKNVAVTVPNGLKIEKIEGNGAVLAAGTDYTQTSTGAAISADWLGRLPRGSYKLTLTLSDGKTAAIAIAVTDSSVSENVQNASFDRYYKSENYADVRTRLSGANTSEDIRDVVLGLSSIDYTFDSSTRSLILPRGVLAQLRAGSYTISVELKNGKTEAFTLTVSDSAPTGESWAVEEYNTFSPSEPKFTLPLTRTSLKSVTVNGDTLTSNKDYTVSGQTLTLKKSALERYRKDGALVTFTAALTDGTNYSLVIDYVKRK